MLGRVIIPERLRYLHDDYEAVLFLVGLDTIDFKVCQGEPAGLGFLWPGVEPFLFLFRLDEDCLGTNAAHLTL